VIETQVAICQNEFLTYSDSSRHLDQVAFQFLYRHFKNSKSYGVLKTEMSDIPENDYSEKSGRKV